MNDARFILACSPAYLLNPDILKEIEDQDYPGIAQSIGEMLAGHVERSGVKGVILGLSGGVDSAVLAYLCGRSLKDRTTAIVMPDTSVTPESETSDAMKMVSLLGIQYKLIDIRPILHEYSMYLEPSVVAQGNLRARIRANILYYYANAKNYLVLGASDKSEYHLGYFTKFGDGASDITPIISMYKIQIRQMARYLGVPPEIIEKKSSPHLWVGHEAENELGATYEEIDSVLYCMLERGMSSAETHEATGISEPTIKRIRELNEASMHKRCGALALGRD